MKMCNINLSEESLQLIIYALMLEVSTLEHETKDVMSEFKKELKQKISIEIDRLSDTSGLGYRRY